MRVLYLCHRVPHAPNRGDRIRAYHTLRYLRGLGGDVHLVALAHDDEEEAAASALGSLVSSWEVVRVPWLARRARAMMALAGSRPLTHVLLDGPGMRPAIGRAVERFVPDVVLAYCSGMARFALDPPLSHLPFVLDMVDVDSEKWRSLAGRGRPPLDWVYAREARLLSRFEARAAAAARATLVVNDRELLSMRRIAPRTRVEVVPNGIDVAYFRPPGPVERRPEVVFTGVFDYGPNASGAQWLLRDVWPMVRSRLPEAKLTFAGSHPSRTLRAAAEADPSVTVTGAVPDLRPFLWRATVSAAPVFVARGLQNKALEAMAAGLPVVTTTAVAEGLPPPVAALCSVADDPQAFAGALLRRLDTTSAPNYEDVLAPYSWASSLAPLGPLLDSHAAAVSDRTGSAVT